MGAAESGDVEFGTGQVCFAEVGSAQVCYTQIRTLEVGSAQVDAAEVGLSQVDSGKISFSGGIFFQEFLDCHWGGTVSNIPILLL